MGVLRRLQNLVAVIGPKLPSPNSSLVHYVRRLGRRAGTSVRGHRRKSFVCNDRKAGRSPRGEECAKKGIKVLKKESCRPRSADDSDCGVGSRPSLSLFAGAGHGAPARWARMAEFGRGNSYRGRVGSKVDWRLESDDQSTSGYRRLRWGRADGGAAAAATGRGARVFRAGDGRLFARVPVGKRVEVYGLRSGAFRDWLIGGHFREFGELPPAEAIRRVIGALEAFARFGSGPPQVFIRVGGNCDKQGAGYYIDLGDVTGHAIEIGAGGWSVVERPGVEFRRPDGLLPLPRPSREGSIELLRPYVNVSPSDFRLLVAWMAAALRPVGPYPILVIYGEQGSAKSTLARIIRSMIDPQDAALLSEPGSYA